jgi:adenine-specific DNA-methyltransferase
VLDVFSGTARVGHALKAEREGRSYRVIANDHNAYAATLARCYVAADREDVLEDAQRLVAEFNTLGARGDLGEGYFTRTFCRDSRYFQPKNGRRIEAIREAIAGKGLPPELEAVMLVSLMEAADRVDSTTGVQMAYLKAWAPRAERNLELRVPAVLARSAWGKGEAHELDAVEAARRLDADVAYVDPPYNQHSYLGNYHVWETLIRWDEPEVYGVACKRVDVRERPSAFNSRPRCKPALRDLLHALRTPTIVVSLSDEGYVSRAEMMAMLGELFGGSAHVAAVGRDYKRYVGAQIGIHNPKGVKVGTVGHLRNTEFLFVASREPIGTGLLDAAAQEGGAGGERTILSA